MTDEERDAAIEALDQFMKTAADLYIASKDCGAYSIDVSATVYGKRYTVTIRQVDDDRGDDDYDD